MFRWVQVKGEYPSSMTNFGKIQRTTNFKHKVLYFSGTLQQLIHQQSSHTSSLLTADYSAVQQGAL